MAKSHRPRLLAALFCSGFLPALLVACADADRHEATRTFRPKKMIFVDNYPIFYFTQRIVGNHADVVFPAPPDGDPAYWTPDEAVIDEYREADLVLLNSANYATWIENLSLPLATAVDTSKILRNHYLTVQSGAAHAHGADGEHQHKSIKVDPNIWLDPQLARVQAEAIEDAVARLLPEYATDFEQNFRELEDDLHMLDGSLRDIMDRYLNEPLLASHPVYNYLARRCGWRLESLDWEPDQVPDEAQWQRFAKLRKDFPAKWMFWEAPPRKETEDRLRAYGVRCVVLYPCANRPEKGDYVQVMRENVERLKPVFQSFGRSSGAR